MSITEFFDRLGAPLLNKRWSWGAIRQSDRAVFLRVWQDRKIFHDGKPYYMLTHHAKYEDNQDDFGYQERLKHVAMIQSGAKSYLVMCIVENPEVLPRKIKSFIHKDVFVGGDLQEREGETWICAAERVPAEQVMKEVCAR